MAISKNPLLGALVIGALASVAITGCAGEDGVDGAAGLDGTDGKNGHDGRNGNDGRDGSTGTDGKSGKDGHGTRSLQFADVGFPWTVGEKHQARASSSVVVNGEEHAIGFPEQRDVADGMARRVNPPPARQRGNGLIGR